MHQGTRRAAVGTACRAGRDTALQCMPRNTLSHTAKRLQTPQSSNLECHVSAIKVRTLWETTFDIHIETASIRALRLYFFGTKTTTSGRATQLCAETSRFCTPKPSRGFPGANSSHGQPGRALSHLKVQAGHWQKQHSF